MEIIQAGQPAPEFSLDRYKEEPFTRADLLGRTTVFVFYPFAFSPVCTDQLSVYWEVREEFAERGATLYGVSCDATWSQHAFNRWLGIDIEQLSDFEPKGATSRAVVRWSYRAEIPSELPGANLIFDALSAAV